MARLVSNIGSEHRKQTANTRKAVLYREMATAITAGDQEAIAAMPTSVPRGKPPAWYVARAERAEQISTTAKDMVDLLQDMEHRNRLEAQTAEEVWVALVGDQASEMPWRSRGKLGALDFWVEHILEDLPYQRPKLSLEQRRGCQQFIRAKMEDLIKAFEGGAQDAGES